MACGSCGGHNKIRVSRTQSPALSVNANKRVIKPSASIVKSLRPANNIDKRQ